MSQYPPQAGPIPVQPLYALPVKAGRPGILTAVGIVSIVVAASSVLGGLVTVLWAFSIMMVSLAARIPRPPPPTTAPLLITPTTKPTTAPLIRVGANGLDDNNRAIVLDTIEQIRPLSEARHKQLDRLLAKCGKQMFPIVPGADLERTVRTSINDSGQTYSTDGNGADYFVLARGRLEINDTRALFDPLDGGEKIRVADDQPDEDATALTQPEIDAIVKKSQQLAKHKLTAAQVARWTQQLQDPSQTLFTPTGSANKTPAQLLNVMVQADGTAFLQTRTGFVNISGNGALLFSSTTWARGGLIRPPAIKVRHAATTMALIDSIGSLLLAVLLLIAGIMVLRQSPRGRMLHLMWAGLKILVVAIGIVGWIWLTNDLSKSLSQGMGAGSSVALGPMSRGLIALSIIALVYPLVLLVVMNLKSIREYYATAR
jgi:hypothetical protein